MRVRATLTILIFILSLLLRRRRRRRRNIRRKSLNRRYFFIISITPRFRSRQRRFSHLKFLYVRNQYYAATATMIYCNDCIQYKPMRFRTRIIPVMIILYYYLSTGHVCVSGRTGPIPYFNRNCFIPYLGKKKKNLYYITLHTPSIKTLFARQFPNSGEHNIVYKIQIFLRI